MNGNDLNRINRASGAAAGFVIASFIIMALVVIVKYSVAVPAIDADRDAAIHQSLMEIRSNEVVSLDNPGWIDRQRGIVRLPIDTALRLAAQEWRDPARARADLLKREQKATAPVAPPAAQPNPFE